MLHSLELVESERSGCLFHSRDCGGELMEISSEWELWMKGRFGAYPAGSDQDPNANDLYSYS